VAALASAMLTHILFPILQQPWLWDIGMQRIAQRGCEITHPITNTGDVHTPPVCYTLLKP
jgi:hypothetical protein